MKYKCRGRYKKRLKSLFISLSAKGAEGGGQGLADMSVKKSILFFMMPPPKFLQSLLIKVELNTLLLPFPLYTDTPVVFTYNLHNLAKKRVCYP